MSYAGGDSVHLTFWIIISEAPIFVVYFTFLFTEMNKMLTVYFYTKETFFNPKKVF